MFYAAGAGDDCVESMWRRKHGTYVEHFDEMRAIGVTYVPVVLSCYGRWPADSAVTLERVCQQAARRLGIDAHRHILRRPRLPLVPPFGAGRLLWRARACPRPLPTRWPCFSATAMGRTVGAWPDHGGIRDPLEHLNKKCEHATAECWEFKHPEVYERWGEQGVAQESGSDARTACIPAHSY